LAEPVVRADHPSANVLSVTETAERHGFKFGRPATSCKFQRDPMFPQAALDVSSGKTQIAAQEMNSGLFFEEVKPHSHRLGLLQIRQRTGKIIGHPLHCGEPDPSDATFLVVDGRISR
jgi:hypothetical protein